MGVWGVVIFVLYVMLVVGGVPLWIVCVFHLVDVVCLSVVHPVAILSAVFCVICYLLLHFHYFKKGSRRISILTLFVICEQ